MTPTLRSALALALVGGLFSPEVHAQDSKPPLQLADFAYSQPLTPAPGRALQTVIVPIEAYRGALHESLADLRVFDPEGDEVPHAIRTLADPSVEPPSSTVLPLFPLRKDLEAEQGGELEIHVERSADGEVIDIRSAPRDDTAVETTDVEPPPEGPIAYYILDTRGIDDPIVKLTVRLGETEADYVLPLRVEASDDLERWAPVHVAAPLVRLEFEGNRIEHDELDLRPTRAKYFRLRWPDQELPAPLVEVVAESQPRRAEPARVSLTLRGKPVANEPGTYSFEAGGFVPADRVHVRLPDANTLIKATLESSNDPDGPWTIATRQRFYRIVDNGNEIEQPPSSLGRRAPRYWRLRVTAGRKDLGSSPPGLTLSFHPDQLLFVARATATHTLAYGSYKASAPDFDVSDLMGLAERASDEPLPRASAKLGPQTSVSGPAALEEPPPPPPLRTYALWALLVVSVLLLLVFAVRLLREPR
jgi:hypothetical protein